MLINCFCYRKRTDNISIAEKIMKYLRSLETLEHQMAKTLMDLVRKGDEISIGITPDYFSTWV